jgi:ribosomal protein L40E
LNATALLSDLRARGVHLEPQGDRLRVVAPRGVLTADLRAVLAEHKGDLLAALQGQCSPTCARCAAGPVVLPDGCELHHVKAEDVARWWALAQERDAEVSVCHCCGGPAPSRALRCRRCEEAGT